MGETQTLCTQEINEVEEFSSPTDVFAKLFGMQQCFPSMDLRSDITSLSVGRADNCDICLSLPPYNTSASILTYSTKHFELTRECTSNGEFTFITDYSSNGTFVNGDKLGKGNRRVLQNNDQIALCFKKNKAWTYMDVKERHSQSYPKEITDLYTISRRLGVGACGEVMLAFEVGTCERFAIKIITKKTFSMASTLCTVANVQTEVDIMRALNHPNIIKVRNVVDTPDKFYIILELVDGGELFDRVVNEPGGSGFPEPIAKLLCYQMAEAIFYLHQNGITHRDLKPENILLVNPESNETVIKVTDFGLSKFVDAESMLKTFCGTPNYLAPEIVKGLGKKSYSNLVDVWSLGVIYFICLAGYPPFTEERKDMDLNKQILGGHVTFPPEHWQHVSKTGIDLVKKMLVVDTKKRLPMEEVRSHSWFQDEDMKTKLKGLLESHGWAENYVSSSGTQVKASPVLDRKRRAGHTNGTTDEEAMDISQSKVQKVVEN